MHFTALRFAIVYLLAATALHAAQPSVTVSNVRRVYDNGEHNAFTDLVRFKGRFYLAFRSCPEGHGVSPKASIIVLESTDAGKNWEPVHRFAVKNRDTRDPHFLVFKNKLFVITGAWYSGPTKPKSYDLNEHLGFASWSADGRDWMGPQLLEGTYGHYCWRAAVHDGKAYLCARRKKDFAHSPGKAERAFIESAMLESDDGLIWRKRTLFQEKDGDETAFLFEPDGTIVGVGRRGRGNAELLRSSPPYKRWARTDLGRYIGGPLIVRWGERTVVAGRNTVNGKARTRFCWLVGDALQDFALLPSGGDTSYPGFIELSPKHALISWYSSHEKDANGKTRTAIYLAELEQ